MPRECRSSKHINPGRRKKGKNLIPIDWDEVAKWVQAGCNGQHCAARIGCAPETLYERCVQEQNVLWTAWMAEKRASGDAMLLAAQYHKALKERHPSLLIWLGKNRLNQKDNPSEKDDRANATADAITSLIELTKTVSPELLEAIAKLSPEQQAEIIKSAARPQRETDQSNPGEQPSD